MNLELFIYVWGYSSIALSAAAVFVWFPVVVARSVFRGL